jgi:hypothetical protein
MRAEGDVVLVYHEDRPTVFARIESIRPDVKKDWYQVSLLLLNIPPQMVTWILRESYVDGVPFTMGGKGMRLEEVKRVLPPKITEKEQEGEKGKGPGKSGTVIPFKRP